VTQRGRELARDAMRLGTFIRTHRDALVALWERRLRQIPAARELTEPTLGDHVPAILDAIATALEAGRDGAAELGNLPDVHALERLGVGYDVAAAAAELAALREVVLLEWKSEAASVGTGALIDDVVRLNAAIDLTLVRSVDRFARARERTLAALDRVSSAALGTGDLDTFLPRLLTVVLETTEAADSAYIMLAGEDGRLHVRAAAGTGAEASIDFSVAVGEGFAGTIAARREPLLVRDGSRDPLVLNAALRADGVHAVYGVPLVHDERVVGVAKMASRSAYEFSEDDQQLLRVMAHRATSIIVQAQLVAARERAVDALEHGDAFFMLDREWRYVLVNGMQEAISHKPRGETLGRNFWEVWPEVAREGSRHWEEYHRCMHERVSVSFEAYFPPLDLWTGVTAYPTRDGGIAVFFRDVSDRKRTADRLARSEARLRRIVESNIIGVAFWTLDGAIRYANDAFLEMVGYGPEAIARGELDWRALTPRDYAAVDAAKVEELRRNGRHAPYEKEFVDRAGRRVPVVIAAAAFPDAPDEGVAFVLDLTPQRHTESELRRSEWELSHVFGLTPDMVCVVDYEGRFLRVNPAFSALLGYAEEELLAASIGELVHPEDRAATARELARLAAGAESRRFQNRYRRKDGEYRWFSWNASPDPERRLVVAAARDVTDEKRRADFEQQLVAIVSHDLRNPLNAIKLSSAIVLRGAGLPPAAHAAVERISRSAERATRMIQDLLDFTRARVGGGIPVVRRPTDLGEVVRRVVDEIRLAYPGRVVTLSASDGTAGPWDGDRVAQVVSNLVSNALTHGAPTGEVAVRIFGGPGEVVLEVHNEGPPIAPDLLPHVFEPYRHGDGQRGQRGSLGLGLYIAHEIVHGHGGSISVSSDAQSGTTFAVRLPRVGAATSVRPERSEA
jgi:PAS domain S-box-containing protein